MNPLLPHMTMVDTTVPMDRQQCVLRASKEARAHGPKPSQSTWDDRPLRDEQTALEEAKKRCQVITSTPKEAEYLGQLILTVGKYNGQSFKWLVENDVGYVKYFVDRHLKKRQRPRCEADLDDWMKDLLARYVQLFPQVSCHLEIHVDRAVYGQGQFKSFTYKEMWQWYSQHSVHQADPRAGSDSERKTAREVYASVRQWLVMKEDDIATKSLKRFRLYILDKENPAKRRAPPADSPRSPPSLMDYEKQASLELDTGRTETSTLSPGSQPIEDPVRPSASSSQATKSLSRVELRGWVRSWENPNGIPAADIPWLKEDAVNGLFTPIRRYRDKHGVVKRRRTMRSDRMWFRPPEPPGFVGGGPPSPHLFFRSRVFVWRPVGVWKYTLKCPRGQKCHGKRKDIHLYNSGYHTRVRHVCDVSGWYTVLTEVLCCGPCLKAARCADCGKVGRWLAWDPLILSQLSEAHRAMFPAILTSRRGVDKNVVRLLRDWTQGNTMAKTWRQIQENHTEEYLRRKDLYTSLLMTAVEPGSGGGVSPRQRTFEAPPPQRELPSLRLFRYAFLLAEAGCVQDYRSQILSTFGTVLKMDSTKKVVKKLSGEGRGSAEWFTSIGNEHSQIVTFALTSEDSCQMLAPMCRGLMERFRLANQPVPRILYVARGCCGAEGPTEAETLFRPWVDGGMAVRLDLFHWIRRFDAATCGASHCKYAKFKAALSGATLAPDPDDLELLVEAVRAKDPAAAGAASDEDVVRHQVTGRQLRHHVRRITPGARETLRRVQQVIDELKGAAGLNESGVSLFKSPEAIDELWLEQQRHLECLQDPPGVNMYRVTHTTTINGVDVPFYKCLRGNNSLEGFHKCLPDMIPGPHCAAPPYQVYLLSGIARWNSNRSSDASFAGSGRHHRAPHSAPLIHRLDARCRLLFGETPEENFRPPADVSTNNELLGLEYLFGQSEGDSFSLQDIADDGPSAEEEVVQPGKLEPRATQAEDEAYESDTEPDGDCPVANMRLDSEETAIVHHPVLFPPNSQPINISSISSVPPHRPTVLPPPTNYLVMTFVPTPTMVLRSKTDVAIMPVAPAPPPALATVRPAPSSAPDAPVTPQTKEEPRSVPCQRASQRWGRTAFYKRLKDSRPSRVHNLPVCRLCSQPTQGHKKHKNKCFCPVTSKSASKGFEGRVFSDYAHFVSVVDGKVS